MAGFGEKVISAQSALDSTHTAVAAYHYQHFGFVVETSAGVSAGAVILEGAGSPGFAGTWAIIQTSPAINAATTAFLGGAALVGRAFPYVRCRISTAIVGGTVDVTLCMNGL